MSLIRSASSNSITNESNIENGQEVQFDNFFALFDQSIEFNIQQDRLDQRLRFLQKRYHPDNVIKDVDEIERAQQHSEQASALINQAYQTLSSPDSRAAYLLDIVSQADTLENSIADLDFLDDAMDMRIELDEAIDDQNLLALQQLYPQITERIEVQSVRFNTAYSDNNWHAAIDATQKLKFLVKLDADITTALDDVENAKHSDDDDLYV